MRDPSQEPLTPDPPRFWWLKRLALACIALSLVLVATQLWWAREADRRLRRALDDIAADGLPVRAADFGSMSIADERNAAVYLQQAASAVVRGADSPSATALEYASYPPYPAAWHALSDGSVKANGMAYVLARRARAFDEANWGPLPTLKTISKRNPDLNRIRHLANIVSDAALRAHVHGDDATALETVRDVRHLARTLRSHPLAINYLVGIGVESVALYKLQIIATGLSVAGEDGPAVAPSELLPATQPSATPRPATRTQVRELIAELLDESRWSDQLVRALAGEQVLQVEGCISLSRGARIVRPMFTLDVARIARNNRLNHQAARQPTWPAAAAMMAKPLVSGPQSPPVFYLIGAPPAAGQSKRQPVDYTRVLSDSDFTLNVDRFIDQDMRTRQQVRMTAVSLAVQLYRADHGDWPTNLAALVPEYLPTVPADPFSPEGAPLRYLLARGALPDGRDRPVMYSVGGNGRDDTPDASALPPAPHFGWNRWRDNVLDLARWAPGGVPATGSATRPANGEPGVLRTPAKGDVN